MGTKDYSKQNPFSLEENLKKALAELLILQLLEEREYYIVELTAALQQKSGGAVTLVFPYAAIYRLQEAGYIQELPRRIAPDGRRRQFFKITEAGVVYLRQLRQIYAAFIAGVDRILKEGGASDE